MSDNLNKVDQFLLQFLVGYDPITMTFSGKLGDDTNVFQMPYNTFRKALAEVINNEKIAELESIHDEWDKWLQFPDDVDQAKISDFTAYLKDRIATLKKGSE
jgi:hypothetical protein